MSGKPTIAIACVAAVLFAAPDRAAAQSDRPDRPPPVASSGVDTAYRVVASRREVRILFPRDTASSWGWPGADSRPRLYGWFTAVDGMDGWRQISLQIGAHQVQQREFTVLDSLVAMETPYICSWFLGYPCRPWGLSASVVDRRVVITLADRTLITRLFALRPATIDVWTHRPGLDRPAPRASARVDYIDPQIPMPNAATFAEARRSRKAFADTGRTGRRAIVVDGFRGMEPLWLPVGESVVLHLQQSDCQYELCDDSALDRVASWSVDGRAVELRTGPRGPTVVLGAVRPGRVTVRAVFDRSPADTFPYSSRLPRRLSATVNVTLPPARLELIPPPGPIIADSSIAIGLRMTDRDGRALDGADPDFEVNGSRWPLFAQSGVVRFGAGVSGDYTLIARLRGIADTVVLSVVPRR